MFKTFDPSLLKTPEVHKLLLGAVAPRPIALASTIDGQGNVNLSPFSFFNVFSANPPILIFSPARRGRDNSSKDTFDNVLEINEVCINMVNTAIVQQISLASTEYPKGVNEFVKAGLTELGSDKIRPPRVAESPVSFECKVIEVKPLGNQGGAGNLVIAEVIRMHIEDSILNEDNHIDPLKLDPVARMGGNWYSRLAENTVFEVAKPLQKLGIGVDKLPKEIRESTVLTGNDLAILANTEELPDPEQLSAAFAKLSSDEQNIASVEAKHRVAQKAISSGQIEKAWAILLGKLS
jgi:flavin reductase (DIM6/NTAB) family NADH-FMN oxidoreductase RutF